MNRYEGSPVVVIERRKGTPDSPFSNMNESLVVSNDGKVILSEIPNELNRVIVTSDDIVTWYEVTEGQIPENGFKVDYINKIVTFNTINVGKQLHFKYLGEGNHYYSPNSIYTKLNEGSVVETLGGLIENSHEALDALERLDEKLNEVTQATTNAITATNDAKEVITDGNQVIVSANGKITEMDGKISEATTKISELDAKLNQAETTISDVQQKSTMVEVIINDGQEVIDNAEILINEVKSAGKFNLSTLYKKNNTVLDNGSTWIALQDTQNNPLPALPIVENKYWRLAALHGSKGDKGDTGAALSILGKLTDTSQLPPTGQAGQAYTVNGELYVWSENLDAWENVGNIKGEKGDTGAIGDDGKSAYEVAVVNGFVGTQEEWLASLKGERGEIGKMTKYEYTIPATSEGQTTLEIPLSTLSLDDDLLLILNGTVLYADTDYTLSGSIVNLKQPIIDYTNSTFFVRVLKNIPKGSEIPTGDGSLLTDGSVAKQKLELSLQQEINATTEHLAEIDTRLTNLESGASGTKADLVGLTREVAYMKLKQEASDRIEGGTVFADDFQGNRFGFTLDEINSRGFKIKNGKLVLLEDTEVPYNVPDSTVVASAYSTAGSGGRKLTMLENGWLVAIVWDSATKTYPLYVSKDKGQSWILEQTISNGASSNGYCSIASVGNIVAIASTLTTSVNVFTYDVVNKTFVNTKVVDSSQSDTRNVTLEIDPTNSHLHVAWASKNATYPNSFNIRYAKSENVGSTWGAAEQVGKRNFSGYDHTNPSIVITDGEPVIVTASKETYSEIWVFKRTGLEVSSDFNWTLKQVYRGGSFTQSSPSTAVDKVGNLTTVWHGTDATHTSTDYIRFAKSNDRAVNWSAMQKLVQGKNGTITIDRNNKYIITYEDAGVVKRIESTNYGDTWTSPVTVGNGTNPSSLYDPTFSLDFTSPPTIYMAASSVNFTGNWTEQVEVPTTEAALIYDIPSTGYVGAFVQKEGNITISAYLNDTLMTSELDTNEYQFNGTLVTEASAKLRLELSRVDTTNGENDAVTRILGGRA